MKPNVLVIGDTILDQYVEGSVDRISPEAPVPVLQKKQRRKVLGGACNVAVNIKSLAADSVGEVDYFGFASMDIVKMLQEQHINFVGTAVIKEDILIKTRYVTDNYQLLRVDQNIKYKEPYRLVSDKLIRGLDLSKYSLIVISDYDKGTFTEEVARYITDSFDGPILIDLKRLRNWVTNLKLVNCVIKCNEKEHQDNRIHVLEYSSIHKIILTLGRLGYQIIKPSLEGPELLQSSPVFKLDRPAIDPVGAGDVFLAGMAAQYCVVRELEVNKMCEMGNKAAAIRVSRFGRLVVTKKEMENAHEVD